MASKAHLRPDEPAFSLTASGDVTRIDGDIPMDLEVQPGQHFLFISHDQSALSHGLHKYPAKFFPELPRWLIQRYSEEGQWVLDPFAGSATVNVEALLSRRHSVALDVDPFARFLAGVKVSPLDIKALLKAQAWLKNEIKGYGPGTSVALPEFSFRDHWFRPHVLEELAFLRHCIDSLSGDPLEGLPDGAATRIRDFFLVCFSSIIRAVSNCDDHCTRTVVRKRLNKIIAPGTSLARFMKAMDIAVPRMVAFSERCPPDISAVIPGQSDARSIVYPDGHFDLAITSPPYVNAVDYPRTHQLEIYWLGMENGSLRHLKRRHIGTEVVLCDEYRQLRHLGLPSVDPILDRLFAIDPRRAFILYKYLLDMEQNLSEVRRVLKPGGRYIIAVGNNRMRGIQVESWRYLMDIAERAGYRIETYFASEIIRHFIKVPRQERIATDWVIVLQR